MLTGAIKEDGRDENQEPSVADVATNDGSSTDVATAAEVIIEPVITADQCADITSKVTEYGVELDKYLDFLGVKTISDIPAKSYGMAMGGLESKRRHNETKKAAEGDNHPDEDKTTLEMSAILAALATKSLSPQIDEEAGIIYVKIAYGDDANKTFLKANGFKWDAPGKIWKWSK